MNSGPKRLVFVVGGAFGFSAEMHGIAEGKLSLSSMTTSHQLVRVLFLEQLYRAFTILNHEPYHND
jgi:23S rRNA (pseudouridine1915-N3)-methyltransferase